MKVRGGYTAPAGDKPAAPTTGSGVAESFTVPVGGLPLALAQRRIIALEEKLSTAEATLKSFGVCMSCVHGQTACGPHGVCTDCLNTGFDGGESPEDIERREILEACSLRLTQYSRECGSETAAHETFGLSDVQQIIASRKGV